MNAPTFPHTPLTGSQQVSFSLDDSDDISSIARELIDGTHPGILTTVDPNGRPHVRWMATTSFDDFPYIYTLTGPRSRKLSHIQRNPYVEWMFSGDDLTIVMNLAGRANILSDPAEIKRVWKRIEDKSHAYFLNNFSERPGVAVLQTEVEKVICSLPESCLSWAVDIDSLRHAHSPTKDKIGRVSGNVR